MKMELCDQMKIVDLEFLKALIQPRHKVVVMSKIGVS